eukprot:CAMPEP_0197823496 /NCGR_PEP_ID=MMETSP1437-20131217/847_1 /TAXON_ID=49252 ORGANISM="Eucampia antarctica, Strain CCMP1452" /NCGR_SAMPLE_ID=MMETSP1437 /ASSEMBLY_ACC=CAM_ASM_001096 /LENGTH=543 /DNA_ID=CAMNT_0043422703 /DNA_START=59 /DNA_END=1690 /DNA_ORIENTATION=-
MATTKTRTSIATTRKNMMMMKKKKSFSYQMLFFIGMLTVVVVRGSSSSTSSSYTANTSRRERNLDHWDVETLAAYLGVDPMTGKALPGKDTYVGNDAAVMFYAQWCQNCHSFAPLWDTIATLLNAGTTDSNLVMALFNCELDEQHTKLCAAAGITHYPTLSFVGSGPYHDGSQLTQKLKSFTGKKNNDASKTVAVTPLPRTVKYKGNLGLGEAVMDWIKTMQGLSTWHKWTHVDGWIYWIRQKILIPGFLRTGSNKKSSQTTFKALPVGVPQSNEAPKQQQQQPLPTTSSKSTTQGGSTTIDAVLQSKVTSMESKISKLEERNKELVVTTEHAGWLIDSFLLPNNNGKVSDDGDDNKNKYAHADLFEILTDTQAWDIPLQESLSDTTDGTTTDQSGDADFQQQKIWKTCMVDMTLDYCTRASTKLTHKYLNKLDDEQKETGSDEFPSFAEMETHMTQVVKDEEPYCAIIASCYKNDFASPSECRPATCPLVNESACRYVSASCLSPDIQQEYHKAIFDVQDTQTNDPTDATASQKSTGGAWGL